MIMPWYVIMTHSRAEWQAHKRLREQGFDTLYLHRQETVSHARRKIAVLRPLYARYLFVAVEPGQSFYAVNTTPGVATIIRDLGGPKVIPDAVIERERARGDDTGLVAAPAPIVRAPYEPGTQVWLTDGAFAGFPGRVTLDRGCEIELDVMLFGRDTPAVVPTNWVSTASPDVRRQQEIRRSIARQRR